MHAVIVFYLFHLLNVRFDFLYYFFSLLALVLLVDWFRLLFVGVVYFDLFNAGSTSVCCFFLQVVVKAKELEEKYSFGKNIIFENVCKIF